MNRAQAEQARRQFISTNETLTISADDLFDLFNMEWENEVDEPASARGNAPGITRFKDNTSKFFSVSLGSDLSSTSSGF